MGKHIILTGMAPDTGNLGVSALFYSVANGLRERIFDSKLTAFGFGNAQYLNETKSCGVEMLRAKSTRNFLAGSSLQRARVELALSMTIGPVAKKIRVASHLCDISGGDSFSDIYGMKRFTEVCRPKRLALQAGIPLILLPQTYGPFKSKAARELASKLVRSATCCWARDKHSMRILRELLGDDFDPNRHHSGVDVAFLLPAKPCEPTNPPEPDLAEEARGAVGINVSGLLYNNRVGAAQRYGLVANYRNILSTLVTRLVDDGQKVILFPHVFAPVGHPESDVEACRNLVNTVGGGSQVRIADGYDDPRVAKWLIGQCAWFCGTRMHSTIAGLSSGVPTCAISYSDKTGGVFESCGQGGCVLDPRALNDQEMVDGLWDIYGRREDARVSLAKHLPAVMDCARSQIDQIAACL